MAHHWTCDKCNKADKEMKSLDLRSILNNAHYGHYDLCEECLAKMLQTIKDIIKP